MTAPNTNLESLHPKELRDPQSRLNRGKSHSKQIVLIALGVLLIVFIMLLTVIIRETNPYLKKRAVALLEEKLDGEVQLDKFEASIFPAIQVHGSGLVVRYEGRGDIPPLISIREFTASSGFFGLIGKPWKLDHLELQGLVITVTHRDHRQQSESPRKKKLKDIPLLIEELVADDAQLVIVPRDESKSPHIFQIHHLLMNHLGLHRAASFQAKLTNPQPPGEIDSRGSFGPWNAVEPGQTPLSATYTFAHADLGVFKGISGILSSSGKYGGVLDRIEVEGTTDTPRFTVNSGGHPVALHTNFKATVDGLNGDTFLHPVIANFLNSVVTANGEVVRDPKKTGEDIKLDVTVDHGRIEDLLTLAVKGDKPLMTGPVKFKTKFDLPHGDGDVADRLRLNGAFQIQDAEFTSPEARTKLEALSRKAKGKPNNKDAGSSETKLDGQFSLADRVITMRQTTFAIPGASFAFDGTYGLKDEALDFHGILRMNAKLSQTMTGFKSFLLKPVDPFFRKNEATQLPVRISGTRNHPSFALDLHRKQASSDK